MLKELLDQIRVKKIYQGKSDITSGYKWLVTIYYKGKWCKMIFHDNHFNASGKEMFLYCLVNDALAYDNATDWQDFAYTFGYKDWNEAMHVYNACEKQSHKLHRLFTQAEIDILSTIE